MLRYPQVSHLPLQDKAWILKPPQILHTDWGLFFWLFGTPTLGSFPALIRLEVSNLKTLSLPKVATQVPSSFLEDLAATTLRIL